MPVSVYRSLNSN
ncbi:2c2452bb-8fdb-4c17-a16f-f46b65e4ac5a [Thermothielavioides terrestris]|uniref:2c2452bb-8fdb-4c17-a16f-f46b65e4ac5a n=1 Tax=Thermothielavioides terrestris TaxID=2587410 RepID=A0A3S4AW91_9PEZI|nr:2c2452bb-8fdb-4c17-a16f-f46b65e4ac5a [Thermothielavioides terrestris]